ncbi:glycosyltransferase family 2 protein [Candidatus Gottesmanbacteria bacterium]|nr:glycosyltransferase family 2 protein [Candidatus Gottesmanbacteria bacterium]
MELTIIIVNHNTFTYLEKCLKSLFASLKNSGIKYEVIVVDNGSNKDEVRKLAGIKGIRLIKNKENLGFSTANNQAVEKARGQYILFLNPDTIILGSAISKLLNFYKSHRHAFIGPKLLNSDKTVQPSCGRFYTLPVVFSILFLKGEKTGLTKFSPSYSRVVEWLSAACILTTKEIFSKLGGFDEDLFLYNEEVDLMYRARKQGFLCYFYSKASIIHYGAVSTLGKNSAVNTYKGLIYFYSKHYSKISLVILKILLYTKYYLVKIYSLIVGDKNLLKKYENWN